MNLQELHETKKTKIVKRALRESYSMDIDFDNLSLSQTRSMLKKVKGLLSEARSSSAAHTNHSSNAYMKLVMMEQALGDHMQDLRAYQAKVIVENEEVQKSQVILAAQDMVDTIQKMLEQISKMNVEELPAVVDGIKNEFGTAEGDSYNETTGQTLTALQEALTAAKAGLSGSLGTITGESSAPADMGSMDAANMTEPVIAPEMPGEEPAPEMEMPEEPEPMDMTGAGRERR